MIHITSLARVCVLCGLAMAASPNGFTVSKTEAAKEQTAPAQTA